MPKTLGHHHGASTAAALSNTHTRGARANTFSLRLVSLSRATNSYSPSAHLNHSPRRASGEPRVFLNTSFKLIFEPLAFWKQYYAHLGLKLPVNTTGSNPTLLLHSPAVRFAPFRP